MIELNREKLDLESYSNGKLKRKLEIVKTIYWFVQFLGILGIIAAVVNTGASAITLITAVSSLFVNGIFYGKILSPVKKAVAKERKEEIKLMNELALNGIEVDTENFSLNKVTTNDSRTNATIKLTEVNEDGNLVEKDRVFGKTGYKDTYYYGKDVNGKDVILSDQEHYYLDNMLLNDGREGYATVVFKNSNHMILEQKDFEQLPSELVDKFSSYLNDRKVVAPKKRVRRR